MASSSTDSNKVEQFEEYLIALREVCQTYWCTEDVKVELDTLKLLTAKLKDSPDENMRLMGEAEMGICAMQSRIDYASNKSAT